MSQQWRYGRVTGYADVDPFELPPPWLLEIRCQGRPLGRVINAGAGWLLYAEMDEGQPDAGPWRVECQCALTVHQVDPVRLAELVEFKRHRPLKGRSVDVRGVAPRAN